MVMVVAAGSPDESCRDCLFNTLVWKTKNPGEDPPDYVDCPCCVLDVYETQEAVNEEGERCKRQEPQHVSVYLFDNISHQTSGKCLLYVRRVGLRM